MSHGNWSKDLLRMRTRYWAVEVMKQAGFDKETKFIEACRVGVTNLSSIGGITWEDYFRGDRTPLNKTVDLVSSVLPGSSAWFYKGPFDLPLWAVLSGNTKESIAMLDSVISLHYGDLINDWDLEQKAIGLIKLFISYNADDFIRSMVSNSVIPNDKYLPWSYLLELIEDGTINLNHDRALLTLTDILDINTAIGQSSLLDTMLNDFGSNLFQYGFIQYRDFDKELNFSTSSITACFGLLNIGMDYENKNIKKIAYYLIQGLCEAAIEYEFEEIGKELKIFASNAIKAT